jgi:type VI secretion system secreted protein Hcp
MAFDCFLRIDGIAGESTDAAHRGEIDVISFAWGATNPATGASGTGSASGRPQIQDLSVAALTSKASPQLFLSCASGRHHASAVLTCRRSGTQSEFFVIRLTEVVVTSYQNGGSSGAGPTDQLALRFDSITVTYRAQRPDGSLEPPVTVQWNVSTADQGDHEGSSRP